MKKLVLCALGGLLLISTASLAKKDEQINLRLNLKSGESYRYQISAAMVSGLSEKEGQKETQDVNLDMNFEIECIEVTDSNTFMVRIGYTEYRMILMSGKGEDAQRSEVDRRGIRRYEGDTIVFEQKWDEISEPMALNIPKLLETKFTIELDAGGHVVDYGNIDQLQKQFPGVDLKQMVWPQVIFPEEALAIGAEWSNVVKQKQPVTPGSPISGRVLVNKYRYRLSDIRDVDGRKCAEISVEAQSKLEQKEKDQIKLEQNTAGTMLIDLSSGMVYRSNLKLEQELDLEIMETRVRGSSSGEIVRKMVAPLEKRKAPNTSERNMPVDKK